MYIYLLLLNIYLFYSLFSLVWALKTIVRTVSCNTVAIVNGKQPLLSAYDFLDVVQLVQGFDGRKVVDVEAENLIANLREHRVVEQIPITRIATPIW